MVRMMNRQMLVNINLPDQIWIRMAINQMMMVDGYVMSIREE
jgi:hypothetical protein